jgi:hypothetical protein
MTLVERLLQVRRFLRDEYRSGQAEAEGFPVDREARPAWDALHDAIERGVKQADALEAAEKALEAADKRLCELTPSFAPDVGPDMRDAAAIEETGAVVLQVREALSKLRGTE